MYNMHKTKDTQVVQYEANHLWALMSRCVLSQCVEIQIAFRLSRYMNIGAPMAAVTAPTGISAGASTLRAIRSESMRIIAPLNKAEGRSIR
jgi:hypothetical protein